MNATNEMMKIFAQSSQPVMCCFMDDRFEEYNLVKIDYVKSMFIAESHSIPFSELRYLIVRQPIFESLEDYKAQQESNRNNDTYYQFDIIYQDGIDQTGLCVRSEKADGIWHIYRFHQGHIFYILIPALHIKEIFISPKNFNQQTSRKPFDNGQSTEISEVELDNYPLDEDLINQFPPELLQRFQAIPLSIKNGVLYVAMADPTQADTLQVLSFISGHTVEPFKANGLKIINKLSSLVHDKNEMDALIELEEKGAIKNELTTNDIEKLGQQKGIKRLLHTIIHDAITDGASDIHLHPRKHFFQLLYRIDGLLTEKRKLNLSLHQALISRIKILGKMNIAEHRLPQDGRIEMKYKDKSIDLRISIMPTVFGESAVIRVLDSSKGLLPLDKIGFTEKDTQLLQHFLHASYGMILVTGPTGSGKSTTLYAAINELVSSGPHIITVEEPVEYQMEGVTQIPVNQKTGYTFARALRNILRHDPDVIMVGEIRDEETAKIAVESALTGHLVLSTLHTNSAASTITRLLEIGIEPYLLKDALIGVIAQRLVRRICVNCKAIAEVKPAIREAIGASTNEDFYHGKGCTNCNHTGVKGRAAVYELLSISSAIKNVLNATVSAEQLEKIAINEGMILLGIGALTLARQGIITAEEAYKVRAN